MASKSSSYDYDRLSELQAFDGTKAGVKGLVDAGVTAVPRIFHHPSRAAEPPETPSPSSPNHDNVVASKSSIVPVIDLTAAKPDLVAQVKAAAGTLGFFQVTNHGVPADLLAAMLSSVRKFHEEPAEAKAPYYSRDPGHARHVPGQLRPVRVAGRQLARHPVHGRMPAAARGHPAGVPRRAAGVHAAGEAAGRHAAGAAVGGAGLGRRLPEARRRLQIDK